ARKACQLTGWNDFSTLDTLATAYAAQGDWSEAVKWQQKAIEFAPPPQQTDLKRRLEAFEKKNKGPAGKEE
ncbi:MAG: tetratricopeptide repeat protein, partial [Pirellulales bacterium]|nr:tetratricopeptide repeat protein [Pirellulales bacterium]